jgi:hypothetical protein
LSRDVVLENVSLNYYYIVKEFYKFKKRSTLISKILLKIDLYFSRFDKYKYK